MSSISASERAMKVMAYVDGELEGAERAEVEKWLNEDAEAALFANDLAELGDYVKMGHPPVAFDIADAVMAKVSAEAAPAPAKNVVSIGDAKKKKKGNATVWVAAALALAASLFLVTRNKEEAPLARSTSPLVAPQNAAANVAAAASAGTVDVENPGHSVSVIYLPSESANVTNVTTTIWVDESGGK